MLQVGSRGKRTSAQECRDSSDRHSRSYSVFRLALGGCKNVLRCVQCTRQGLPFHGDQVLER